MTIFKYKEFVIADGEAILDINDDFLPAKISSQNDANIVTISTPNAITAGTFSCYVELAKDTGFFGAPKIGDSTVNTIDATKCGATVEDGLVEGWSFTGSPYRLKVVATGVTGVTSVNVVLAQNAG